MKTSTLFQQFVFFVAILLIVFMMNCTKQKIAQPDYPIQPIPFNQVTLTDDFWLPKIEINRKVTIPFALKKIVETGRMDNFLKASGRMDGSHEGKRYNDTDVYKVIESIAYSLKTYPDPKLEAYTDSLIHEIAMAQEPDGYLFTGRTIDPDNPAAGSGRERWINLNGSHELYNSGHLYEAAVAYWEATGKRELLDVSIKNADLLLATFGPQKEHAIPGHQEIELALVKLYRVTGTKEYLDLARFFLDQRGKPHDFEPYPDTSIFAMYNGDAYMQDHLPVLDQTEAVGHAVRASYMYSGMADYAAMSGSPAYTKAVNTIWEDVVYHKIYITGGIGARHTSEAFGDPYELPNKSAYTETCASIGNVFWNLRLFLSTGESKYFDVLEKTLYNGLISGVSLSGDLFFYQNPLEAFSNYTRSEWFEVSCCPGNIVRFLPSLPGYIFASNDQTVYVNLLISGDTRLEVNGFETTLSMKSEMPWEGKLSLLVSSEKRQKFELAIRKPGWLGNSVIPGDLYRFEDEIIPEVKLFVNGDLFRPLVSEDGYWIFNREWSESDLVQIEFEMPVRKVLSNEKLIENKGKVAFQRGPIVYCFESIDNPEVNLASVSINPDCQPIFKFRSDILGGIGTIEVSGQTQNSTESHTLIGIPYFAWSNRWYSDMKVWVDFLME